jgi:hypothetical protein
MARTTIPQRKSLETILDKAAAADYADMTIVDHGQAMAYHPDYGWLYTDNEQDKVALGLNPHLPLNRRFESDHYSDCKPKGKPANDVVPRGIFSRRAPRPSRYIRKLMRPEDYRTRALV